MSRYTPVAQVKWRCNRAEEGWRALVKVIHEEAAKPGYGGPSPASVERVLSDMLEIQGVAYLLAGRYRHAGADQP